MIIQHLSINYQVNLQLSCKFIFALKLKCIDVKIMLALAYFLNCVILLGNTAWKSLNKSQIDIMRYFEVKERVQLAGPVQADNQIPNMVHQLSPICMQSWLDHTYPENEYKKL